MSRILRTASGTGALIFIATFVGACDSGEQTPSESESESEGTLAVAPDETSTSDCTVLEPLDVVDGATLVEGSCYETQAALAVGGGTLTVEPGVHIAFGPDAALTIDGQGRLNAAGTADKPITFTSIDAVGRWKGIHFSNSSSADNVLHHANIENGGSSGWTGGDDSTSAVLLSGSSTVDIRSSTISGSGGQGITIYEGGELVFEGNTLRGNEVAAWIHPNVVGAISGDTVFESNTADVVRVVFGNTDRVTDAQTWSALAVPYEIRDRHYISGPLTIEPGAVMTFVNDASMIVETSGSLTAAGTAADPITFTGVEPITGFWKGLQITSAATGNVFDFVIFENGGSAPWTGDPDSAAAVYLEGNSKAVFTNTTFRGSGHYGLWVPASGDITGFDGNLFEGNGRAMILHPNRVGALTADNTIRDNTENKVRVTFGNTDVVTDAQTWQDLDSPFYVTDRTYINAAMTIAEGVEIEFAQDASFIVSEGGSLRANGAAGSPVVFRGGEDVVGYWQGIQYETASAENLLASVAFLNAGSRAWTGDPASVGTIYVGSTAVVSLSDVSFARSGGHATVIEVGGRITCSGIDTGGLEHLVYQPSGPPSTQSVCP